jgi:hypothetical protein
MVDDELSEIGRKYFAIRKDDHKSSKRRAYGVNEIGVQLHTLRNVDHSQGDPKICSMSWKSRSRAGCALGMYCGNSVWFFPRLEASRSRQDHSFRPTLHPQSRSLTQMLDLIVLIPKVHEVPRIRSRQVERTVIFSLEQNVCFSRHR